MPVEISECSVISASSTREEVTLNTKKLREKTSLKAPKKKNFKKILERLSKQEPRQPKGKHNATDDI